MRGHIKTIVEDRGFGFITGEDGNDYFFHHSNMVPRDEFTKLKKKDRVTFEDGDGEKGLYAEQVLRDESVARR